MVLVYKSGSNAQFSVPGSVDSHRPLLPVNAADVVTSIDIQGLLRWVYCDQKADKVAPSILADVDAVGFAGGGCAFDQLEQLGILVRGGGNVGNDLDPDALAVHEVVESYAAMGKDQSMRAGALVLYARAGFDPGVYSEVPSYRCVDLGKTSYFIDNEEIDFIPNLKIRKPSGYEGPAIKKGQACEVRLARDYESHDNELKKWELWASGLEELYALIPVLRRWKMRPFKLPAFVKR
ncbi:MAG: hypothetical protein OIF56_15045 [Cohaesibacter sp.]|nr:hypothetical protein [Cohaesibacter sp.]